MKAKRNRKRAGKKTYVGPRVTILQPESVKAQELSNTLRGESPGKAQDIGGNRKTKSSKVGKL
jgi:hypothetical protein